MAVAAVAAAHSYVPCDVEPPRDGVGSLACKYALVRPFRVAPAPAPAAALPFTFPAFPLPLLLAVPLPVPLPVLRPLLPALAVAAATAAACAAFKSVAAMSLLLLLTADFFETTVVALPVLLRVGVPTLLPMPVQLAWEQVLPLPLLLQLPLTWV